MRVVKNLVLVAALLGALVFLWTKIPLEWWYQDRRPTGFGKATNRAMGKFAALGVPAFGMVTLEVPGRKSGKPTSTVLVLAKYEGREFLVSMLGHNVDWVKNVHAAGLDAVFRHGKRRPIHLVEVAVEDRAPLLKRYAELAPGGRRHIPVALDAPLEAWSEVAADYPVFWVEERGEL